MSSSAELAVNFHILVAQKVQAFYLLPPLYVCAKDLEIEILILSQQALNGFFGIVFERSNFLFELAFIEQ